MSRRETRRPRVYTAHPMTTYGTEWAASHVASLAMQLPGVEVVDPEALAWPSDVDWLLEWPDLLDTLSALVVFGAPDRSVGIGCIREVADAILFGLPVAALDRRKILVELRGVRLLPEAERSAKRAATAIVGNVLDKATLLSKDRAMMNV
jgi:hypothetical protein